mgnify:CR=1 FL=1
MLQAVAYAEGALAQTEFDPNRIGFLMGLPGIQSVAALAYNMSGQSELAQGMIDHVQVSR